MSNTVMTDGTAFWSAERCIVVKVTKNVAGEPLEVDKANAVVVPSFSEITVEGDVQTKPKRGDNRVKDSISYWGDGRKVNVKFGRLAPAAMAYMTGSDVVEHVPFGQTGTDAGKGLIEWGLGKDFDFPDLVVIGLDASGAGTAGNHAVAVAVCKVASPPPVSMTDEDWSDFEVEFSVTDAEATAPTGNFQRVVLFESKTLDVAAVLDALYPTAA